MAYHDPTLLPGLGTRGCFWKWRPVALAPCYNVGTANYTLDLQGAELLLHAQFPLRQMGDTVPCFHQILQIKPPSCCLYNSHVLARGVDGLETPRRLHPALPHPSHPFPLTLPPNNCSGRTIAHLANDLTVTQHTPAPRPALHPRSPLRKGCQSK